MSSPLEVLDRLVNAIESCNGTKIGDAMQEAYALIDGTAPQKSDVEKVQRELWAEYEKQIHERVHGLTVEAYDCIYEGEPPEEREVRWKWVMNGIQNMKLELEEAKAQLVVAHEKLIEAKKNEAVCHCGALFSEHTQSDNHGPVAMEHPCPNEEKLRHFGTHLSHCNFGENSGFCKYGEDDCPALSESWSWVGKAIDRGGKLRDELGDLNEQSEESMRDLAYKLILKDKQWRDRYVGTLMMLAFDGCISDSRARELAEMSIGQWRDALKIMLLESGR